MCICQGAGFCRRYSLCHSKGSHCTKADDSPVHSKFLFYCMMAPGYSGSWDDIMCHSSGYELRSVQIVKISIGEGKVKKRIAYFHPNISRCFCMYGMLFVSSFFLVQSWVVFRSML